MNPRPIELFTKSSPIVSEKVRAVHHEGTAIPIVSRQRVLASDVAASHKTIILGEPLDVRPKPEQLFAALAAAKIWTSKVAMHLGTKTRDRVFKQLDVLHDPDEWTDDDHPLSLESYKTFVRAVLFHEVNSRPALSLMPSGNLLALWRDGNDKLTIEFMPGNRTRWFVQNMSANGPERISGTSPLERLRDVLQPYGTERWFDGG